MVRIYIEGDGHSYVSASSVSTDPTPHNPLALKLALRDPFPLIVYLARPCQFTPLEQEKHCQPDVWTENRFSEKIIESMNEAITKIKKTVNAQTIELVGFSGGAAIAILVAARRNDVKSLRTVAGDLDHVRMADWHQTIPLTNALNPKETRKHIAHIPQHHFAGQEDKIVPPFISQEFIDTMPLSKTRPLRTLLPHVSHHQGWEACWPRLIQLPLPKND